MGRATGLGRERKDKEEGEGRREKTGLWGGKGRGKWWEGVW